MKRKFRIPISLVLFCFLTLPFKSCVDSDDYDFDKLSEKVDWQPDFTVPVGYGEYSLWYLLDQHEAESEDETIVLGEDGLIHIKYIEKDIFNYEASEVLNFPNDEQLSNKVNIALPAIPEGVPLGGDLSLEKSSEFKLSTEESDIILSQVKMDTKISFSVTSPINKDISLSVVLLDLEDNVILETESPFEVKQTEANPHLFVWQLSDVIMPFNTTDPAKYNLVKLKFNVLIKDDGINVSTSGSNIGLSYQLQDIQFKLAQGDFGNQSIDIGSGDIDMDVDFWDDIDGNFTFADPRINIQFKNKVGVPFKVTADMTGSNTDGDVVSLDPDAQTPAYPKTETDVLAGIEASILYNKDNSQIVPFMALPPSGNITYSGSVVINPDDYDPLAAGSDINIISGTSSITADLEMDIPLDFKADNLSINDTINDIDIDDADKIVKAKLIITSENGLPLNVKIDKIYFTDINYIKLDSLDNISVIKAAGVNETTGEVDPTTITKVVSNIELSEKQILSLNDTENIIINAGVDTYDEGSVSVKLRGKDKLKFTISVSTKVDLSK